MELNKMTKTAGIAAAVLAGILIISIALSAFGKKDATADNTQNGTENVTVDADAPKVVMKQRYVFTNDITKLSDFHSCFLTCHIWHHLVKNYKIIFFILNLFNCLITILHQIYRKLPRPHHLLYDI